MRRIRTAEFGVPRGRAGEESDSVEDFSIVLLAYPAAEPTGNALAGIQTTLQNIGGVFTTGLHPGLLTFDPAGSYSVFGPSGT